MTNHYAIVSDQSTVKLFPIPKKESQHHLSQKNQRTLHCEKKKNNQKNPLQVLPRMEQKYSEATLKCGREAGNVFMHYLVHFSVSLMDNINILFY